MPTANSRHWKISCGGGIYEASQNEYMVPITCLVHGGGGTPTTARVAQPHGENRVSDEVKLDTRNND